MKTQDKRINGIDVIHSKAKENLIILIKILISFLLTNNQDIKLNIFHLSSLVLLVKSF